MNRLLCFIHHNSQYAYEKELLIFEKMSTLKPPFLLLIYDFKQSDDWFVSFAECFDIEDLKRIFGDDII